MIISVNFCLLMIPYYYDDDESGKPQVVASCYQRDICSGDRQNRHKNNRNTNITISLSGDMGTGKMHSGIPSNL